MNRKTAMAWLVVPTLCAATAARAGTVSTDGEDLIINTKGGLEVRTTDGDYAFELGGRLQYDYNRSELNGETDEDDFDVRRARLFAAGTIRDWAWKAQFNIGDNNGGEPEDLYIRYNGWGDGARITVGKQKMPFGLEELTSSKDISLLERSAMTETYALGRHEGIQFHGVRGDVTYAVAGFEDDSNDDDGFAWAARGTWAPVNTGDQVVHFGAAYRDMAEDEEAVGLEAAAVSGPFHIQGEYGHAERFGADRDGYYVQAGWILTGETRPYKKGVFKRVKSAGPYGAWELVARYEDGDGDYGDIELGATDATAWGLGLNWYLNDYVRLGVNYTDGDDNDNDDDGSEFRARIQLAL